MIKSRLAPGSYGNVRIIESAENKIRYYVIKTNMNTWVLSDNISLSLSSMIEINREFHFTTLKDLHEAFNLSFLSI